MEKTIIKFDDIKIAKQKFLRPNSIKTVGIGKIVVSNNVPLGKKGFKLATKILKNLYLYVYFSQK